MEQKEKEKAESPSFYRSNSAQRQAPPQAALAGSVAERDENLPRSEISGRKHERRSESPDFKKSAAAPKKTGSTAERKRKKTSDEKNLLGMIYHRLGLVPRSLCHAATIDLYEGHVKLDTTC